MNQPDWRTPEQITARKQQKQRAKERKRLKKKQNRLIAQEVDYHVGYKTSRRIFLRDF